MIYYPKIPHVPWSKGIGESKDFSLNFENLKSKEVIAIRIKDNNRYTYSNGFIYLGSTAIDSSSIKNKDSLKNIFKSTYIGYGSIEFKEFKIHFIKNKYGNILSYNDMLLWEEAYEFKVSYLTKDLISFEEALYKTDDWKESYVIRNVESFSVLNFSKNTAKYFKG